MTVLEKYNEYPRKVALTVSENIVFSLLSELDGRKDVLQFDQCDEGIQDEMIEKLVEIVDEKLGE